MGRKQRESECGFLILLAMGLISFSAVYIFMSSAFRPVPSSPADSGTGSADNVVSETSELEPVGKNGGCCKGVENLELRGDVVKRGTYFKFDSSEGCCEACKAMCTGKDEACLCDSWVFCGNKEACGDKFGECWLKKQKDVLAPEKLKQEVGNKVMWTSGIIFGRGEGIVGLETEYGTLRIQLLPDCSPRSVAYILESLLLQHCAACHFYRAEGRGKSWDVNGNHIKHASFGPPYGLIQGTLGEEGQAFDQIQSEHCPTLRKGSVAWVGSGPVFFISLVNHEEWGNAFTVFGLVFPKDMVIAENIARLPTKSDVWNNVNVSVLEKIVPLRIQRVKIGPGDLNIGTD